ncbi:hypothetical protein TDB9533_01071 [Thalassocella blandensis]|nr:hypothetical protein TDB9533_01071 [Thalassocella blandensis]
MRHCLMKKLFNALWVLYWGGMSIFATADPVSSDFPTIVYWQGAASEARQRYEAELIQMLFKLSEEKYGRVSLKTSVRVMSTERAIKKLRSGEMHLMTAPFMFGYNDEDAVIVLPYMIAKNMLGYRQLIVREEEVAKFNALNDRKSFNQLIAGQGTGWGDIQVYEYNGLKVTQASKFEALFPMLQFGRFDYLPLGLNEASETFKSEKLYLRGLQMVDKLIVFYPWPVNIMVSRAHPKIAERMDFAMQKALANGDYDALFDKYFKSTIEQFNGDEVKIIKLKTPRLDETTSLPPILLDQATIIP